MLSQNWCLENVLPPFKDCFFAGIYVKKEHRGCFLRAFFLFKSSIPESHLRSNSIIHIIIHIKFHNTFHWFTCKSHRSLHMEMDMRWKMYMFILDSWKRTSLLIKRLVGGQNTTSCWSYSFIFLVGFCLCISALFPWILSMKNII